MLHKVPGCYWVPTLFLVGQGAGEGWGRSREGKMWDAARGFFRDQSCAFISPMKWGVGVPAKFETRLSLFFPSCRLFRPNSLRAVQPIPEAGVAAASSGALLECPTAQIAGGWKAGDLGLGARGGFPCLTSRVPCRTVTVGTVCLIQKLALVMQGP